MSMWQMRLIHTIIIFRKVLFIISGENWIIQENSTQYSKSMTDREALINSVDSTYSSNPPSNQYYGSIQTNESSTNETNDNMDENKTTLNFVQKIGYSLGHVFNDLCAGIWFR